MKSNIYFTSDWHIGHKNICKGISNWENTSGCRPFDDVETMNEMLLDKINSTANENDVIYNLGDFSFTSPEETLKFRNKIKCKNIHFILGNHDGNITKHNFLQKMFISICNLDEINVSGIKIVLCHYPMFTWNGQKNKGGSWMLHGHCHNSMPINPFEGKKIFDVGIDNKDFKLYTIEDLKEIFDTF